MKIDLGIVGASRGQRGWELWARIPMGFMVGSHYEITKIAESRGLHYAWLLMTWDKFPGVSISGRGWRRQRQMKYKLLRGRWHV